MPREPSRRSSKTSIISVDPAVASHITKGATLKSNALGSASTGHTRTESNPARTAASNLAATANGHNRTISAPSRNIKNRSNSLRRAKNSTEILKSRAAGAERNAISAEVSGVKRGRTFTVSNVATGGYLHLSPSPNQAAFTAPVTAPSPYPWTNSVASPLLSDTENVVTAPQVQHSRTRSISPRRLLSRATATKGSKEFATRPHMRSQSFSTLDESRKSVHSALQPKTLRIVINRPESAVTSDDEESAPTLQIPIPHYKLGTPRFSAHGTPFLRGASYNRSSAMDSSVHSSMADGISGPPISSLRAFSKIQHNAPSEESVMPMPDPLRVKKMLDLQRSISDTNYTSPISPELYDALLRVYDDPSTVKYANAEKDVAAATKIRIIAQISSESFMDYDLVSDFFLTFRSYMTTFEVLDYLLARLKWSVGRLSDDGRIIRIRTFAALRHWILNYFAEDFVVNRHLRLRFCEEVNDLYESVRNRPRGMAGVSDLKILQDLKRCWNGRCALYWDAEAFNMDADQEAPLMPGGVLGSRNPAYADISEATAALGLGLQEFSNTPLSSISSRTTQKKTTHKRLPSSDFAKKPLSIGSEKSLQPTSCSIPRSKSKSPEEGGAKPGRGPQPVSVLSRRQNAPEDLKVHVHRQPSEGDERHTTQETPVETLVKSGHYIDPHAGSMIRGFVYGPVEPFIQLPINPPLSPSVRFSTDSGASPRSTGSTYGIGHAAQGPAVKNIFGSIRRALSGKQGSHEVTFITVSTPNAGLSDTGRRAPVPLNLASSHDDLRRKATGLPHKTQLRIDLLCAAAVQSFQAVVPGENLSPPAPQSQPIHTQSNSQALLSPPLTIPDDTPQPPRSARLPSHYTARSGSILIVDDTAVAMPVMSGALADSYMHSNDLSLAESDANYVRHDLQSFPGDRAAYEEMYDEDEYMLFDGGRLSEIGVAKTTGLPLPLRSDHDISRTGSAVTVRKRESSPTIPVEEDMNPPTESLRTISPPPMTEATSVKSESPVSKAPAHGLRRRPGGDLKKVQNVHDMEIVMQHKSLDSMLESSSNGGSLLIMGRPTTATSPQSARKPAKKVSMINTHSSQHLRPSFEYAVAGFSSIPDDDDGGLEATLLKLEGRYEDKSPSPSHPSMSPTTNSVSASSGLPYSASTNPTDQDAVTATEPKQAQGTNLATMSFLHDSTDSQIPPSSNHFVHRSAVFGLPTESHAGSDSEESEISLPILKRNTSQGQTLSFEKNDDDDEARSSSDILETRNVDSQVSARPETAHTDGGKSFLLDDDENISDLSSEISVEILTYTDVLGKPISPMFAAPGTAISGLEIPSHPLTHASLVNLSMQTSPALAGAITFTNKPPTPQQSPALLQSPVAKDIAANKKQISFAENIKPSITAGPAHVPFILACESDILAQQMTLVEQSALTEIEWTDLVEMRWSNDKSTTTLDWAEYMANHDDARGVDVVATRFNLVIKWVLSEIVLTKDIEERARVLCKLIHVAAHARRLRNYATMLQITIALMSTSCSRLKKTWDLVPGPDKSVLKHMERLAQPLRNFHDLRIEMESTDLTDGCIPFLGLYIHDLTYNAQKPAEINVGEGLELLINFERFRTSAIIIKGLLRLIDASLRYDFEPLHGIVERCLWLSALTDDRIDALSKSLE